MMTLDWAPAALADMTKEDLRERFAKLYKKPAPPYVRRSILLLAVGHQLQEAAFGGLDVELARRLTRLDAEFARRGQVKLPKPPVVKPGTTLLREWQGVTHTVTVTLTGFIYKDRNYRSLSAIAREITGTQWSGPRFFGVLGTG
jgi:hypothetical protein